MSSLHLFQMVVALLTCFSLTYYTIPFLIKRAEAWQLQDKPTGRKKHLKVTPVVGGLAVGVGLFVSMIIGAGLDIKNMMFVLLALLVLLLTGVIDDRRGLSPAVKWGGQAVAAALLIFNGQYLYSFHDVLGMPVWSVPIMMGLSLIFITGLINGVNLMDGMDGLVGGITAINFAVFGLMFMMRGDFIDATFALLLTAGLMAFLIFNFAPARIFMGDGGSLMLGGALAYFFIRIWNNPENVIDLYLAVSLISFPVFDMVRVFVYRLMNRRSPFSADRAHFHHYLSKTGLRHAIATLIMYVFNLVLILQAIFLSHFGLDKFIIANLLFFLLLFYLVREHSSFYQTKTSS